MEYGRNYGGGFALPTLTPAIKRLLILNGIVFLLNMVLLGALSDPQKGAFFALSWSGMGEGYGLGLLRLLTYQFTHSFQQIFHILFNMLVLYFFGTMAESRLGYRGTYKLYVVSGLVGGLASILLAQGLGRPDLPLVGASGACYGLLVYAACTSPHSMVILIIFPIKLWVLATALVAVGVYQIFVEMATSSMGGVSHGAHLGGALWGFLAHRLGWYKDHTPYVYQEGLVAGARGRLRGWLSSRRGRTQARQQAVLDELLDKVHREGISALTAAERRFLDRASKNLKRR